MNDECEHCGTDMKGWLICPECDKGDDDHFTGSSLADIAEQERIRIMSENESKRRGR